MKLPIISRKTEDPKGSDTPVGSPSNIEERNPSVVKAGAKSLEAEVAATKSKTTHDEAKGRLRRVLSAEEEEDQQSFVKSLNIGDLLIPGIGLTVFILLVIFVYIPFGTGILDYALERNDVKQQIEQNNEKIANLQELSSKSTEIDNDLTLVKLVVPDEVDVSVLAEKIDLLAQDEGLEQIEVEVSDAEFKPSYTEEEGPRANVTKVSGPYSYRGELADIKSFLSSLKDLSQLVSVDEMSVKIFEDDDDNGPLATSSNTVTIGSEGSEAEQLWEIEIVIGGYSSTSETTVPSITAPVPTTFDQDSLDEIEELTGQTSGE